MAKIRTARCVCVGSRSFTYGASRGFEKLMKEPSKMVGQPIQSSNSKIFTKPVIQAKG